MDSAAPAGDGSSRSFLPNRTSPARPEFWVVSSDDGAVMGFMGLSGSKMEALFLAPEFRGRGAGRQLVQHARTLRGELTTDVNEQHHAARRFYEGCGFVVEGRSELDDTGRPYPLLHAPRSLVGRLDPGDEFVHILGHVLEHCGRVPGSGAGADAASVQE